MAVVPKGTDPEGARRPRPIRFPADLAAELSAYADRIDGTFTDAVIVTCQLGLPAARAALDAVSEASE